MDPKPGYGLPLRCPKCPPTEFFGMLKIPGRKAVLCPNCGTGLISMRPRRRHRPKVQIAC